MRHSRLVPLKTRPHFAQMRRLHPDESTEPTPAMVEAAEAFVKAIRSEYRVWQCEPTHSAVVDVAAWVRDNAPHWLPKVDAAEEGSAV